MFAQDNLSRLYITKRCPHHDKNKSIMEIRVIQTTELTETKINLNFTNHCNKVNGILLKR